MAAARWISRRASSVSTPRRNSYTTAKVVNGIGVAHTYTDKNASDEYLAPGGTANALKKTASGWTETQPDGFERRYDTDGGLELMVSPSGDRWTIVGSGALLSAIIDPTDAAR